MQGQVMNSYKEKGEKFGNLIPSWDIGCFKQAQ